MSSEEALSLIITLDLSRETYNNNLRSSTKMHKHQLYPLYYKILIKLNFIEEEIFINEQKCEVTL